MSTITPPSTDADLFDEETLRDPYPTYSTMREMGGAVHMAHYDIWALTRYDAVRNAAADTDTFSSTGIGFNDVFNGAMVGTALASDPPVHDQRRQSLAQSLAPKNLRAFKESIDAKAEKLVSELADRQTFDAIEAFARALPVSIVLDLIGLDEDMKATVLPWASEAFNNFGPMEKERTVNSLPMAAALFEYIAKLDADALAEGSFGRTAFKAMERGEITRYDVDQVLVSYIFAGLDTTIAALGHAIHLFGKNPAQWDIVRANPESIPNAFNEILRIETPLQMLGRRTLKEVEVDGVLIPEGASIAMLFGCANRDARHYPDPDRFDVQRDASDHLAFGYGVHSCAGQGLARLEVFAALGALASRVRRFHVGEPEMVINNTTRSLDKLPVTGLDLV